MMSKDKKKFNETKVGEFLSNNVPEALEALEGFPAVGAIKGVLKLVGVNLPQEKEQELNALLLDYEKELLQDKESARNREILINQSEHASWLAKNTASLIALAYTAFTFVIYILVLMGHLKAEANISILIVNSITNIAMLIVGYYYGSSERKSKGIKEA
jgi:VIT1/CCC1 family predicted Fe2+/Mn2+ transporter